MVEKIIVNPESVRGYGNIIMPKTGADFEEYNCTMEVAEDTINNETVPVYVLTPETTTISLVLSSDVSTVTVGGNVVLSVTVTEDEVPVSGQSVSFKLGSTEIGTGTTNSSGVATYTYTTVSSGSLNFSAVYAGHSSNGVSVVVNKKTVTATISASSASIVVGSSVTLTGTVKYNNTGISGIPVTFKEGTTTVGTGTTNSSGVATCTVSDLTVGSHSFTVTSTATDVYDTATSSSTSVTVLDHSYSLAFSQSSYPATSGSATLELTLTDNSVPVSGATVSITGSDSSSYSCITNSSGVGTVTVSNVSSETTFTASYQGATDTCTVTVGPSYLFYDACDSSTGLSNYSMVTLRGSPSPTLTFDSTNSCYVLANNASSSGGHSMMAIDSLAGENSYVMSFKTKPYNTTDRGGTGYAYKGSNGMYSIYYMYYTGGSDGGNITVNQGSSDSKQSNIGTNHRNEWITHIVTVTNGKVTYSIKDANDNSLYTGSALTPTKGIQSDTKPGICILWWDVSKSYVKDIKVEAL